MPAEGILPALDNSTQLSKVYGSVLQPRDTLTLHSCAHCRNAFLPDETIFPDPTAPTSSHSFVCRPCFTANGGSKGDCATCGRVVLGLANEGGFIESAGRVWHKRCFRCASCHKDVSTRPMVDLLGRPSCEDCFDNCLKPRAVAATSPTTPTKPGNIGGMKSPGSRSREGSPALEELQAKLGIKSTPPRPSPTSRESSPAVEERRERTSARFASPLGMHRSRSTPSLDTTPTKASPVPASKSTTPTRSPFSWSRKSPAPEARTSPSPGPFGSLANTLKGRNRSGTLPQEEDEFGASIGRPDADTTLKGRKRAGTGALPSPREDDARCATCGDALFSIAGGGRVVRIDGNAFHASCFTCDVCRRPFQEDARGQALFVRGVGGRGHVHVDCAPPLPTTTTTTFAQHKARSQSVDISKTHGSFAFKSPSMVDVSTLGSGLKSPPIGSRTCPGCNIGVAPMERGVVQGPSGSKWHASCLVCGGKGARKADGKAGCGKKLDSGARCDEVGTAWCRECWMLLPRSPQASPLSPTFTGMSGMWASAVPRQNTGQSININTGLGLLSRQNTGTGMGMGGSVSRPGSPVKQLGITHSLSAKPRPQSVGRGMFLVKQMTGQS
ncbi:hypothetical protein EXIGLDRAFT_484208 [Exidia glandulosa HHB12029]|uniref:LIM zinc-binding domain-containing protein n=1 Tax=Exidia glandulosa HHB12029 TaxID=1314781 RepID=A0A166BLM5_EXIGL|nr:hypothetical protein EXIGLDRAFT_484208 [Exidia glandulosa HHB12029]